MPWSVTALTRLWGMTTPVAILYFYLAMPCPSVVIIVDNNQVCQECLWRAFSSSFQPPVPQSWGNLGSGDTPKPRRAFN